MARGRTGPRSVWETPLRGNGGVDSDAPFTKSDEATLALTGPRMIRAPNTVALDAEGNLSSAKDARKTNSRVANAQTKATGTKVATAPVESVRSSSPIIDPSTGEKVKYSAKQKREGAATVASMGIVDGRKALEGMLPGAAIRQRGQFERANPERYSGDVLSLPAHLITGESGHDHTDATHIAGGGGRTIGDMGLDREGAYKALGWNETESERLPGHIGEWKPAEPHEHEAEMLDLPDRWEDMHPKQQERVLAAVAKHGVTPDSARAAFGTQLDRAMAREGGRHASFYEAPGTSATGDKMPLQVLRDTMARTKVGMHVVAAANAITSPRSKFIARTPGKDVDYPNARAAEIAINAAQAGTTGEEYQANRGDYDSVQALPSNIGRAIDMARKVGTPLSSHRELAEGEEDRTTRVGDVWQPGKQPGRGAGDKVRAFFNAWLAPRHPEGQFFVSDIHSGGWGMAPHLDSKAKTQYLGIAGVHAFHDKIARDVMRERGLTNVSRTQSAQWNQNKLELGSSHVAEVAGMAGGWGEGMDTPKNKKGEEIEEEHAG